MPQTKAFIKQTRRARAIVIAVTAAAILLFGGVSWHNYGALHEQRIVDAEADADRVLLAVDDHVTHLIEYADSYVRALRAYYIVHGNGDAFRDYVATTRVNDHESFIGEIVVIDPDGHPIFMASRSETPKIETADLDYFQALKSAAEDTIIVDPTRIGRTTGEYQFRVARAIRINGAFQGVIMMTMQPNAIIDLFRQYDLGEHSSLSVLHTTARKFLARLPVDDRSYFAKSFDQLELWDHLSESTHGLYHAESPLDHRTRYYAFVKAHDLPIASVIGIADQDIVAGLTDARRDIEIEVAFFALGAIVIGGLVLRIIGVEERLRRSHTSLIHAQRMGKIGSVEVDLVAMKATWSEELYRIYDRDRALGPATLDEFLAYVHPDDRETVAEMRDQHMQGAVKGANEYRILLRDGTLRWIHREVEVVRDPSDKPIKLIASEQDITDQKRLDQAKDAFVSTVSHELRTPLTSIRGALALVASGSTGALPEKTQKLFDIALRNSERLSRLVNDLLDLQRMGSGSMVYHIADIVLAKVVTDAIDTIRPFAKERDIDISFASTCPDAMVHADLERIGQVMDNLLSNAIKFSKPGQTIGVTLVRRKPWLRVTIEDHGDGIPETFRSRIFQRFAQADSSDTRKIGGSGLGLSIVQSIVTHHGGHVSFETEIGRGTRFHIDLEEIATPAAQAAAAKARAAEPTTAT